MITHAERLTGLEPRPKVTGRRRARLRRQLTTLVKRLSRHDVVAATVPRARGERVLVATRDRLTRPVVATDRALYHHNGSGANEASAWTRLAWEHVGRVHQDNGKLTVTSFAPARGPDSTRTTARHTVLDVSRGEALVELIRERLAWSTLLRTRISLGDSGSARVLVRRRPGAGELVWIIAVDDGIDANDSAVQAKIEAALASLRVDAGL